MTKVLINLSIFVIVSTPAFAYLGPGMGGGILVATLGVVIALFAAVFGLIWFPLKKLFRKKEKKNKKID